MNKVICPKCGAEMVLRQTSKFRYPSGKPRKFYGCPNWPQCDSTLGAHPNGEPMGFPADEETKQWRIKAHDKFDSFCHKWNFNRPKAYRVLQKLMKLSYHKTHFGKFGIPECQKAIQVMSEYKQD